MRLYHSPRSRSARVLWTLEELGISYDITLLSRDERRGDQHRRLHPLGRVPVLELDDGRHMFESIAICLYLADLHPEANLVPAPGSAQRPIAYQWLFFAATELESAAVALRLASRAGNDTTEAAEHLREVAGVLEDALSGRDWLLGDSFTVVDLVIAKLWEPVLAAPVAEQLPTLTAFTRRAQERPAYVRADAIKDERGQPA